MESLKQAALRYLAAGWSVIPAVNKVAVVDWDDYQLQRPTAEQVAAWWDAWPDADVCVALGRVSGVVRVDVDGAGAGHLAALGPMPETAEFSTRSGGRGYLLQWEEWATTAQLWRGEGEHQEVRIQSDGAYTVVPPSAGYAWVRETPVARPPVWMLDIYAERAMRATPSSSIRCDLDDCQVREALDHVSPDDYDVWVRVGMALKSRGDGSFALWDEWSKRSAKYKPGETARKWAGFKADGGLTVATVVHLAKQAGFKPSWSAYEPLTEGGNANVLTRAAAGKAGWSPKLGWLAWDGRRWATNEQAECIVQETQKASIACMRASIVAGMLRTTGDAIQDEVRRKQRMKALGRIDTLDKATSYRGSRDLARSAMVLDHEKFNRNGSLLNFSNGTLNLETGALKPHDPADLITEVVPHEYKPSARSPALERFLSSSIPDAATREYVRLKMGSALLGETRKELVIFWGPNGDNGKTVLIELMLAALGPGYAVKCSSDLLLKRAFGGDDDRNTVMLYGKRFAAASETNEGAKLNEAMLKELTGGDNVTSRYLYHEKFTFAPTHDIVYVTNHKPVMAGVDAALWSRIRLVEFPRSFPPGHAERVEGLKGLLLREVEGAIAWLTAACRDYVAGGRRLPEPPAVAETTATYRSESNPVARFMADCCWAKTDGVARKTLKGKVVEAFKRWQGENGDRTPFNNTWFGRMLTALGVGSDRNYYHLAEGESAAPQAD